ncbi:MAG: preprotein translocase subunit YajC [Ignavibacteria bacterium GWA2_55_11]|nr:MAG: preprotein translocase subunit YajC [Ignavibacteria bacterium GWA2_55_11]OGU44065.1 MAG: preprotein translocase subunit YajC [Ignavibacteria bacterium GWC2_56_12]OGU62460.1 MAG: preprotein translocase subunit YajC [Ignavibacteria bacterium RIFCSPHIGHO2_02_FULL_56_12]OGU73901.1 MAG: preprotein translocase subunit YajC [Ignavibacteria bacterium RIFCSPLOWO2_12_FULL_56_21]OGU75650.1 MAG: preprotein translocase subunit YajC [Ignavibacteria bacterium RIFCSPLOWO2_02_FULL_55_14]HAV24040.1 prep
MSPQGQEGPGLMSNLLLFGTIIAIFYFMIIRPQQKREKERKAMLSALKKGDKVVTSGGIHGSVSGLDDKTVLVQIADNVKIKVDRGAITAVVKEAEPATK